MFNHKINLIIFTMLLFVAGSVQAEVITLESAADTWIQNADVTHGSDPNMVLMGANTDYSGYVRFDLAAHNVISVEDATLTFTVFNIPKPPYRNDTVVGGRFSLYGLDNVAGNTPQNWDENALDESNIGIEWSTNGGDPLINVTDLDDDVEGITETVTNGPGGGWDMGTTITITGGPLVNFIQSRIDDDGLATFILCNNDTADRGYGLGTRENDNEDVRPRLELAAVIGARTAATKPSPANGDEGVLRDVILDWTQGVFADTHDVYIGTDFNDVSLASPEVDPNNVYLGRFDSNSTSVLRLEFNQTYFWRVDEVNAPPDLTVFPGVLWSFSTEPLSFEIPGELITATADSSAPGQGPEQTINGSGLVNDLHSTQTSDMWLSAAGQSAPVSIQYEFDKPYKLHEMQVWNYNGESILYMYGLKDVTVEYSADGDNWMPLEGVSEFPQATGETGYASGMTVEFGGITAKYVRITTSSNWSGGLLDQYGLSEVRFTYIPTSAREPSPANGATDIALDSVLGWKAGREAVEHNIYLSKDKQSVIDGTAFVTTTNQSVYGPLSLGLGSTYYWRIDEVNNAEVTPVWQGGIWSFTTQEYLVVDNFESYNDIEESQQGSNLVYLTWIDGFDNPDTNGSTMGYFEAFQPTMETSIVHGGRQSAPVFYNNTTASVSEVTVNTDSLPIGHNWASASPEFLSIWIYGDPNNSTTEQMYVKIGTAKEAFDGDLTQAQWQEFSIDLASLGIDLSNVTTLTVGFEKTGTAGGSGMILLDDIRLYTPAVLEQ